MYQIEKYRKRSNIHSMGSMIHFSTFFFAFDCLYRVCLFRRVFSFIIAKFFPLFFVFTMSFWKNNKKEITNFHLPILIQHYNATCVDVHTTTTCMTIIICDSRIFFPLHYQLHTLYMTYKNSIYWDPIKIQMLNNGSNMCINCMLWFSSYFKNQFRFYSK